MRSEQTQKVQKLKDATEVYEDFPKPGVRFLNIMPIIGNPELLNLATDLFVDLLKEVQFDNIFMLESRGFFFGVPLSLKTGKHCYPCRKKGKLPGELANVSYGLQYGSDTIEIQKKWVKPGDKVLIIDDVLATGGTMNAAIQLLQNEGAIVQGVVFLNIISVLNGVEKLKIGKQKVFYLFDS